VQIKTANGKQTLSMTRKEWLAIGKRAGWDPGYIAVLEEGGDAAGLEENTRFHDPRTGEEGTLVTRTYHGTTLWMMLYDSGEIQELTLSDLKRIEKI
jgi:hypothetical protein